MESVSYEDIVSWLENNGRKTVPTLGRKTVLYFWVENRIIYGSDTHGNSQKYSRDYWDEICRVIDRLPVHRREITTEYISCKNHYFSQGVPALCRAYCEDHR